MLRGLSSKFLSLTILFVMLIEMLILVPSVANFRQVWLMGRLDQSRAALGILDRALGDEMLSDDLLMAFDAEAIILVNQDRTERIADPAIDFSNARIAREDEFSPITAISAAWSQLFDASDDDLIRIVGEADAEGRHIELVLRAGELRSDMLTYMRNIVLISILIALVVALLIYAATRALLIRPVQELTGSMLAFASEPEPGSIIEPSDRRDELGQAQRELARMQQQLADTLLQQRRLAELGLAVSKINHDMRNILAAAQLVTDRLTDVEDPVVQRVTPRLIRAIDRAVRYSEGVLEYGRAGEAKPEIETIELGDVVDEVRELAMAGSPPDVRFEVDIPSGYTVNADRDQLLRILMNLVRNAVQALAERDGGNKRLAIVAAASDGHDVISVSDNGPGIPPMVLQTLFQPFTRSSKKGGTGLGLSIARELVEAHGGTINVESQEGVGTTFTIRLPRRDR